MTKIERFADVISISLRIAEERLSKYDSSKKEVLSRNQLEILIQSLKNDRNEVLTGEIEPYQGQLFGPIKGVIDWGESDDSELLESLHQVEVFYRENY